MTEAASAASSRIHNIHIIFVPQSEQRYPTLGDWQFIPELGLPGLLRIRVTQMPDQRYSWPIAVHELIEALLCSARGITSEMVDGWDITGHGATLREPGADPRAPYHAEHETATEHEYKFAQELGITAREYDAYTEGDGGPEQ